MTREEKNQLVIDYVNQVKDDLEKAGHPVSDEVVKRVINRYIDSDKSFDEIRNEIDKMVEEKLEEIRKQLELLSRISDDSKNDGNLDIENIGITINEQDIDLMMIANATTPSELQAALNKITNINYEISDTQLDEEQFIRLRQNVYDLYIESLSPRNDYFANPSILLSKKIEYLRNSGVLDSEELKIFDSAIKSGSVDQIITNLSNSFSKEKLHQIFQIIKDYSPIEKAGVIGTDLEAYQRLFHLINSEYNSLTLDEVVKYGNVALYDGTFDFSHLQKTLEFAKENGKQVRLNTILFYMDCPDNLYNLDVTEENKQKVKQVLLDYVKQTTAFIRDNGYDKTVRSIDVFNELLNRFAMDGDVPYQYRGDILQDPNVDDFDNIKSGWLKFLDIEDLCDVIAVARENLPDTDFMYNDDNVIDSKKIPATTEIINRIKQYEISHGVRLIDSIGTQMHIDNSVTKEQIIDMFNNLSQYGLPIEITEFDMAMICNVDGLSEDEINNLRMKKMAEFYETINECKDKFNIRGNTIWSKTDSQNFRVSLENEQRIKNGQEPIKTLHGGFYNDDMTEKRVKTKEKFQDYNYHTHTYRSGHSEYGSDEDILESAKNAGISMLGFSEHVPNTDLELPDEDYRMLLSEVDDYISSISESKELSVDEKRAKLERKKQAIKEIKPVLNNQKHAIENSKNTVVNANGIGCESREEYSTVVTQMTQQQTTRSESQKLVLEHQLSSFQESKAEQKTTSQSIDKPKVMQKTNNNQGSNTSSSGFTNTITLALIFSFVCGILFMLFYMLINR